LGSFLKSFLDEPAKYIPRGAWRILQLCQHWQGAERGALLETLRDQESTVGWRTTRALGWIKDAAAAPGFLNALRDQDRSVPEVAARSLERITSL
jgi:hypothetical protein